MDAFARGVYAVFGALAIVAGIAILAMPTILVGPGDPPVISHLLREQAAGFVFIGLMCFWARTHFSSRRPVHTALLVFTALFSGVHWLEFIKDSRQFVSPLINTIPFVLLLITAPRRHSVRDATRASL